MLNKTFSVTIRPTQYPVSIILKTLDHPYCTEHLPVLRPELQRPAALARPEAGAHRPVQPLVARAAVVRRWARLLLPPYVVVEAVVGRGRRSQPRLRMRRGGGRVQPRREVGVHILRRKTL